MTTPLVPVASTWSEPVVDKVAEGRILLHDEEARKAGFSPAQPLFAIGTRLAEVGKDNFKQSRLEYEQMPTVEEALTGLIETVRNEQRQDFDVQSKDVRALADGRLYEKGSNEPLLFTPAAFKQFVTRLAIFREVSNPASYFADIDPARRAEYLNAELDRATDVEFKLRTRQPNGAREIFAVTSHSYATVDADKIAQAILGVVDPKTKADVLYRGTRSRIDLLYHTDLPAHDVGVGEFYKAAQRFTSDDDGTEGIRGAASLFRALCINLTTAESSQRLLQRRHIGEIETILSQLRGGIGVGLQTLKFFLEAFQARTQDDARVLAAKAKGKAYPGSEHTPGAIVRHIFDSGRKLWVVPGTSTEQIVENVTGAWLKEADAPEAWSVTGLSNAMSRAAHEGSWPSIEAEQVMEDLAGELVRVPAAKVPFGWTLKGEQIEQQ